PTLSRALLDRGRGPFLPPAVDASGGVFAAPVHRLRRLGQPRGVWGVEHARVDAGEGVVEHAADVDAAARAHEKVGGAQAEAIADEHAALGDDAHVAFGIGAVARGVLAAE